MNIPEIAEIITATNGLLKLNLKGKKILTEAANSCYAATACVAAYAGADVFAYAIDNKYSTKAKAMEDVSLLAEALGVRDKISFVTDLKEAVSQADIITNSYSFRPLDRKLLEGAKKDAIVLLMYEDWERRNNEIEYSYCKERDLPIVATDESTGALNVFDYVGKVAVKCLLENNINIQEANICLIGYGKFYESVNKSLKNNPARLSHFGSNSDYSDFKDTDVFIYCDYSNSFFPDWQKLRGVCNKTPYLFQLVGIKNCDQAVKTGFKLLPAEIIEFQHMAYAFDYLGPQPAIELISLSYKAGEDFR